MYLHNPTDWNIVEVKIIEYYNEELTMRFYNVEMKGKFKLEKKNSVPVFNPDDEGMMFYYNDNVYYSDSTGQVVVGGGGGGGGDAVTLNGQPGGYYLCADNQTGTKDANQLEGQAGAYYLCSNNATGVQPLANGGTGATNATTARTNLGLDGNSNTTHYHDGRYYTETEGDARYGQLASVNTWTQQNRFNGACTCFRASHASFLTCINNTYTGGSVGRGLAIYSCGCALFACSYGSVAIRAMNASSLGTILGSNSLSGVGVCGYSDNGLGVCGQSTYYHGLAGRSSTCFGVVGYSNTQGGVLGFAPGPAICGCATGAGPAVSGNGAYSNTSSKYLKHLNSVCVGNCIRETPLNIYKYYWEDANMSGFDQYIGPTAEDFNKTFSVYNEDSGDEYEKLWSVDGVALALGVENLKDIDKLKSIVEELYSCIQKLEG